MLKICFAVLMLFLLANNGVSMGRLIDNSHAATLLSIEEERKLGRKLHADALEYLGVYDHPDLAAYVDQIGKRLLSVVGPLPFDVSFTITNTGIHSGSAGHGGYIYIDRLMLGVAENEDEVAGVLAHEISHVVKRDWAKHQGFGIANSCDLTNVVGLDRIEVEHLLQQSEYDADLHAVQIMADAGYDPIATTTLIDAVLAVEGTEVMKLGGRDDASDCVEKHPPWEERRERAQALAKELRASSSLNKDPRYLKRIEGMIFGPNLKSDEFDLEGALVIYKVKPGDTFRSITNMEGIDGDKSAENFEILNRIGPKMELPVGTLLKLVR